MNAGRRIPSCCRTPASYRRVSTTGRPIRCSSSTSDLACSAETVAARFAIIIRRVAMLVTKQPVLRRFWYPIMPISYLGAEPKPFTLLGENIVVWKTADNGIACLQDRCCHRTAKLSLGFVEEGHIVCGYLGW